MIGCGVEKEEECKGVVRWLVDISKWNPSQEEFSWILSLLPLHDQSSITRYVKMEDRKRGIVSRLLQYALVHQVLGIPFHRILINRTFEGKPYLDDDSNFNFNTSHHGDYVGIASEPFYIIGLDIVSNVTPQHETPIQFVTNFSSHFTSFEWANIMNAPTCDDILAHFYRYWCLKEAYVKAIGAGLGYKLDRIEFHHTNWTHITVHIDGKESTDWRFWLSEVGKGHWVSLGRGHPRNAVENYKRTLRLTEFEEMEYPSSLQLRTKFVWRTVKELLPVSSRVGFGIFTDSRRAHDRIETEDASDESSSRS